MPELAPIERQFFHLPLIHHIAHGGILGLHRRNIPLDHHRVGNRARRQDDVHAAFLTGFEYDSGTQFLFVSGAWTAMENVSAGGSCTNSNSPAVPDIVIRLQPLVTSVTVSAAA